MNYKEYIKKMAKLTSIEIEFINKLTLEDAINFLKVIEIQEENMNLEKILEKARVEQEKVLLNVYISKQTKDKLNEIRKREGMQLSFLVERILKEAISETDK